MQRKRKGKKSKPTTQAFFPAGPAIGAEVPQAHYYLVVIPDDDDPRFERYSTFAELRLAAGKLSWKKERLTFFALYGMIFKIAPPQPGYLQTPDGRFVPLARVDDKLPLPDDQRPDPYFEREIAAPRCEPPDEQGSACTEGDQDDAKEKGADDAKEGT
jgi:hypothetical protein